MSKHDKSSIFQLAGLLITARNLIEIAIDEHIYSKESGEKPDDDCPYVALVKEVDALFFNEDSNIPLYAAYWGEGYTQPGLKLVDADFFSAGNGYSDEDREAISNLKLKGIWRSHDSRHHYVVRVGGAIMGMLHDYEKSMELTRLIARMNYDGEEIDGEDDFIMENDDAVSTLSELIQDAREILAPVSNGNELQSLIANMDEDDFGFLEQSLSNDENSSDEELVAYYAENGTPELVANEAVKHRMKFMNGMMQSGSLKQILQGGEGHDFMDEVKETAVTSPVRIVARIQGGKLVSVAATHKAEAVVLDSDIEGLEEERAVTLEYADGTILKAASESVFVGRIPEFVDHVFAVHEKHFAG